MSALLPSVLPSSVLATCAQAMPPQPYSYSPIARTGNSRSLMDCSNIQFKYADHVSEADLAQVIRLFKVAAFWAQDRSAADMATAIAHSFPIVTAWDGDLLMGFARATSDGVFRATIWDVVIDPAYQGGGLGRKMVETLVSHPHMSRVERIYLMTTRQQGFYQRIGFEENPSTTMVLYNNSEVEMLPVLRPSESVIA